MFFCAGGLRSALAAQTAQRMGLKPVAHIDGGFGAWKKAGGPVEMPASRRSALIGIRGVLMAPITTDSLARMPRVLVAMPAVR